MGLAPSWEDFDRGLLEKYVFENSMKMAKKDLMDWVESPRKGRCTITVLQEFEKQFLCLLTLDRIVLDRSKVLLFLKIVVDALDREKMGLLLENEDGLMIDWATGKWECGRINKR